MFNQSVIAPKCIRSSSHFCANSKSSYMVFSRNILRPPKVRSRKRLCARSPESVEISKSLGTGIRMEGISRTYKNLEILKDVTWDVRKGERVGLVGVNGCGKSTQLKLIAGIILPDEGVITKSPDNLKVAYLSQDFELNDENTLYNEFLSSLADQKQVDDKIKSLENAISCATEDLDQMSLLLDELSTVQNDSSKGNGYEIEKNISSMMAELGFDSAKADRVVSSFSGGWKMKISLGKILLQEPDILLLDEPTNHLDIESIEWLENYLMRLTIPMVIVSHDREFLDVLCNKIVETKFGRAITYQGNYSAYQAQRILNDEKEWKAYERQQNEIRKLKSMVSRLSGGAQSSRAESARNEINRLESPEYKVMKPQFVKPLRFQFPPCTRSGENVAFLRNVSHAYKTDAIIKRVNLDISRGDKIALVGPNGSGKSTVMKLLSEQVKPSSGQAGIGPHNVVYNFYNQNQAQALDVSKTVLRVIEEAAEGWDENSIKSLLGKFLFRGDAVYRKVEWLSGGEKARLALAKFMATPANLLLLDEPTNHLDIPSKEILEQAIRDFDGTCVIVSHDRYFIKQVATRILELKNYNLTENNF